MIAPAAIVDYACRLSTRCILKSTDDLVLVEPTNCGARSHHALEKDADLRHQGASAPPLTSQARRDSSLVSFPRRLLSRRSVRRTPAIRCAQSCASCRIQSLLGTGRPGLHLSACR